jgi:hypothetical protein
MFMIIQYKTKHRLDKKDWEHRYPIDQICEEEPPFRPLYFKNKESAWKQLQEWGIEKEIAELQNIEVVGVH